MIQIPRRLGLVCAMAVALSLPGGGVSHGALPSYMSCGSNPIVSDGEQFGKGSIRYHQHPRNCNYSSDGTEAGRTILLRLNWRGWGRANATAKGLRSDNHDQDNNGFQRHRVTITLSGRVKCVMDRVTRKGYYYTRMRIREGARVGTIPLTIPVYCRGD